MGEDIRCRPARNRRGLLANEIFDTCTAHAGQQVNVTSLACGPAREVFDAFERLKQPSLLNVTGVDIDQEALELLRVRCIEYGLSDRVNGVHGNLIYMATGRQELALPPQNLVYSIGLIDYFNDEFVVKLMDWIYDLLRPGGRVILGNFHPRNPDKAAMRGSRTLRFGKTEALLAIRGRSFVDVHGSSEEKNRFTRGT